MRLFNARKKGFLFTVLLIVICAFFESATTPVAAQPLLEREQEILTEDRVVEAVRSIVFNGRNSETVKQDLRKLAELKLNQMETFCSLTIEQRRQLKFAAAGDATRFLHEVTIVGRKLGRQLEGKELGPWDAVFLIQACEPLSSRLKDGLYRKDSLYEKVRDSILSEDQVQKLEAIFEIKLRHRSNLLTPLTIE